jgi:hypothetical protein
MFSDAACAQELYEGAVSTRLNGLYGCHMDAAVNSLLGVVAGGAVTYATQRGLDGRRERRTREREARSEKRAAEDSELTNKAAARLVFMDLLSVFTFLRSSRDVGRWWIAILLPHGAWDQHREQLCRALSDHAFRQVGSTLAGVEAWNAICGASRRYYWVRPHLPLRQGKQGMTDMRDTLLAGSARALLELAALGFGTLEEGDPLIVTIQGEA